MTHFVLCDGRPLPANNINELDQLLRPVEFNTYDEAMEYIMDFDGEGEGTLTIKSVKNPKVLRQIFKMFLNRK